MPYFNSRPSARGDIAARGTSRSTLFQFTPLREGRPERGKRNERVRNFNSRPSARGDSSGVRPARRRPPISIHAPPRGATVTGFARLRRLIFQFTPLREGRRAVVHLLHNQVAQFQFTPLREGRHYISGKRRHCRSDFNSRPSARGDAHSAAVRCFSAAFQFTPLREGRLFRRLSNVKKHYFNSRPSARGDARLVGCAQAPPISIHAPPRGATRALLVARKLHLFQFTPLREGRPKREEKNSHTPYFNSRPSARGDEQVLPRRFCRVISIHAPPRGATPSNLSRAIRSSISIHAPPRGATVRAAVTRRIVSVISIHAPPRGATVEYLRQIVSDQISIHAPPRGATRRPKFFQSPRPISIHAPPRGATHQKHFEEENTIFQFTPLREGRHRLGKRGFSRAYFNSRPSARGDRQHEAKYAYRRYFNSRPSARGDIPHGAPALQPRYFNSRPSARGDRLCTSHKRQLFYFNSRPSARGDANVQPLLLGNKFQFTPLREGRHARCV